MDRLKKRYRYSIILLKQLVKTDFKLRYQGSALGYVWTLLRPLALFVILYIVFGQFIRFGDEIPNYEVYLLVGIVLWNYFAEVTNNSVKAIVDKGELLRKINFPKYVIVLAGSVSALINLAINVVVIAVFMIITDIPFTANLLFVPIFIAQLFVLALGMSFLLSAVYVRLRDINYVWEVIMQGAFYATPILYPLSLIPLSAAKVLMLSPVAQIIQDVRYLAITPNSDTISSLYMTHAIRLVPVGITVGITILAVYYFRKRSRFFAEEV
ncbi:MAG: ABC transporter permease [Candidatus Saccharibacteria bacterium]|nr:ABC transporter permease [Candidatus Saccharibacteria bacterium]